MLKYLFVLVLLLSGCSTHVPFDKTDYALLGASSLALAADYQQTVSIRYDREKASSARVEGVQKLKAGTNEDNPILGKHPSDLRTGTYFASCLIANTAIAYVLPPTHRKIWLGSVLVIELVVVRENHISGNVGLKTIW